MSYYNLTIRAVVPETTKAVTVTFDVPNDLQNDFRVNPGQYLKLKTDISGESVERFYSICDFGDDFVQVGIKRVENGLFSNYACDHLKAGDTLAVEAPQGDFHLPDAEEVAQNKRYCFVAAGSGITPNIAMIRTLLNTTDNIDINLIYVNPKRADIMFFRELEDLKNAHLGRFNIINVLTRESRGIPMLSQRPDADSAKMLLDGLVGPDIDHAFMCGPLPLIELFREAFLNRGMAKSQVHMELFGTPENIAPPRQIDPKNSDAKKITVISQGVEQEITIRADQDVLDAALHGGVSVPFACKGGVCATCKARRLDGEADMVLNYGLEDDDVENGMMLTCQTYVTSDTATFDFDVQ